MVTLWNEEVLVEAQPGESVTSQSGGAGYCGGGGGLYYTGSALESGDGGTDGASGKNSTNYPGGVGSGFNLASIPVNGFTLRYQQLKSVLNRHILLLQSWQWRSCPK